MCGFLAWHHPLGGAAALSVCAAIALAAWWRPGSWPLWLLPALPAIGWMTWTGWLMVEELDLAVLAFAAGAYLRRAFGWPRGLLAETGRPALGMLAVALVALSLGASAWRGIADAGGWQLGWWQGYHEPMNALRLAKGFAWAVLLWPLWRLASRLDAAGAAARFSAGMVGLLLVTSLLALWERLAFTGLLDFSSNYRTTALFWEMHVGGAALDAVLALGMPFAAAALPRARGLRQWLPAAAALLLGGYACLTTFSRIVYLAVPLGLAIAWGLGAAQGRRRAGGAHDAGAGGDSGPDTTDAAARRRGPRGAGIALVGGFVLAAAWLFPAGGYRAVAALLCTVGLLLPLAEACSRMPLAGRVAGIAAGVLLSLLALAAHALLPKGAYVAFAGAALLCGGLLALPRLRGAVGSSIGPLAGAMALGAYLAAASAVSLVGLHWGGDAGLRRALPLSALLALAGAALAAVPRARPWPTSWRWQGERLGLMAALAIGVGVFAGGAFMSERLSASDADLRGRQAHWGGALALLDGPLDWSFGRGLGRYASNHMYAAPQDDRVGDYRLVHEDGRAFLRLASGRHQIGWGQILRISQRVPPLPGPARLRLLVRAEQTTDVHAEVCEKHLLYNAACLTGSARVTPQPGVWTPVEVVLSGGPVSRGELHAPKLIEFGIGLGSPGQRAEIDDVVLTAGNGMPWLRNTGFDDGLARWYFTSDHLHMPWHMKNMAAHVLFEQGALGLGLLGLLTAAVLLHLTVGTARDHPLAPPLAAALVGLLVVGLTDSLLDMPRIVFLFHVSLLVGLSLQGRAGAAGGPAGPVQARV